MISPSINLPLSYFGNVALYAYLYSCDNAGFSANELYPKQTNRTRTKIMAANGLLNLTVPVIRPNGKDTLVKDVEISYAENWTKEHLKSIESAYRNTPYFIYYFEAVTALLESNFSTLQELNWATINLMIDKLGLSVEAFLNNNPTEPVKLSSILLPKEESNYNVPRYIQTFEERHGFISNLSILDLLFNEGPNGIIVLSTCPRF